MTKYRIVPKRDFGPGPGFFIEGRYVKTGFVVVRNGVNVMPGATWAQTIREALVMIRVLEHVRGNADRFWKLLYRVNGATARSRKMISEIREMAARTSSEWRV